MNELVQPLCDLKSAPIDWLWANNLSFGNLALFDGDPGLGKSMVALDLCARLSTGRPFPGTMVALDLCARLSTGRPFPGTTVGHQPASAIILNAEDSAANSVRPRLCAMGADLARIHVVRADWLEKHGGLCFPSNTLALENALADTRARLIVIDPITAFLDRAASSMNEMSVRATLGALARIATLYGAVILMIRHLNKMSDTCSIYRGTGSIAFQGVCRSSWLFGVDPVDKDRRIMAQVKNNYAPLQKSLVYEFQHQGEAVTIHWAGTSKLSANQLLAAAGRKPDLPGPIERAMEFLLAFLQERPRPTTEIWPAAQRLAISQSTLSRARRRAAIRIQRSWTGDRLLSFWLLKDQKLAGGLADHAVPDIQELLRPLVEKYPTTPLDR
jgi:RecA-family ATPase